MTFPLLFSLALLGAGPRPEAGERAPAPLLSPDLRVHVIASEALPADALAALARPNVVLWLTTRSNALAPGTARALARFEEAFVQVRPPLSAVQADTWGRAPGAGLWLAAPGAWTGRLGARPVAVEAQAAQFDTSILEVKRLARVQWAAEGVDVATWARLAQARVPVTLHWLGAGRAPACEPPRAPPRLTVRVRDLEEARAWARCGFRVRLPLSPKLAETDLGALVQAVAGVELEVHVGADERRALRARRLLDWLDPRPVSTTSAGPSDGPRASGAQGSARPGR